MAGKLNFPAGKATDDSAARRLHTRRPGARERLLARDRRTGKEKIAARGPASLNYASPRKLNSITLVVMPDAPRPKRSPATNENKGLRRNRRPLVCLEPASLSDHSGVLDAMRFPAESLVERAGPGPLPSMAGGDHRDVVLL